MLVRTYVKRLRMEAPLRSPPWPDIPRGFTLVPWADDWLRDHAEIKYRSFRHSVDATIFPNLGILDGCLQLMRSIAGHPGFVREATWLACGPDGPCGCIQGVANGGRIGMIQNLAVLEEYRGYGVGKALLRAALCGFRAAGLSYAQLEVCARNGPAVRLYQSVGFVRRKTLYREARTEYTEYAI
jgi:ribosomal protein S18 acetylase RimI-like enzyme